MTLPLSGIYKITNTKNGRVYVGQSQNVYERRVQHFTALRNGTHENKQMQKDYKIDNRGFRFDVVEFCSIGQLNDRELYWITKLKTLETGYNIDWKPYLRKKKTPPKRKLKHYHKTH